MTSEGVEPRTRRLEQRASERRAAVVRCWARDGQVARYATLADLSLEGARVITAAPPEVGAVLDLRFRLREGGAEVTAEARVVWRSAGFRGRGGVMGVHFSNVLGAEEIAAYIEAG